MPSALHSPLCGELARAASSLLPVKKGPKAEIVDHFLPCGSALAQPDSTPWLEHNGIA